MMLRRLYLGSVSSLSFEEEENDFCYSSRKASDGGTAVAAAAAKIVAAAQHGGLGDGGVGADEHHANVQCSHHFELHEMLTDRLHEQVRKKRK
jgi:hypothetical protein